VQSATDANVIVLKREGNQVVVPISVKKMASGSNLSQWYMWCEYER
jgi:hypothetical protein